MKLSYFVRKFILDNQVLIEENRFDELYQKAIFDLDSPADLSAVLVKSGINPLPYIGNMTNSMMFSYLDISNICRDQTLYIPENIESIGVNCFENTTGFNQVKFPTNLKYINDFAFYNTQITELNIPGSVKIVTRGAFSLCDKLKVPGKESDLECNGKQYSGDYLMKVGLNVFGQTDGISHVLVLE